jgi:AraC family transcriptional activator of pobA
MAKRAIDLSKQGGTSHRGTPIRCRILLSHKGCASQARTLPEHTHPFWQVEIITHGPIGAIAGDIDLPLGEGQVLLIPPHCEHGFVYEQGGERWYSLKFSATGVSPDASPMLLGEDESDPEEKTLIETLRSLLPTTPEPSRRKRWVLEHLLGALLAHRLGPQSETPGQPDQPLIAKIASLVQASGGRRVAVSDVAEKLGYSVSHVSSLFRKHCDMPLKTYLDLERSKVASRLLEYSDLNITEIAEALEFPDVFSFSRFFRRVVGMSPRSFRKTIRTRHARQGQATAEKADVPEKYVSDHSRRSDESRTSDQHADARHAE